MEPYLGCLAQVCNLSDITYSLISVRILLISYTSFLCPDFCCTEGGTISWNPARGVVSGIVRPHSTVVQLVFRLKNIGRNLDLEFSIFFCFCYSGYGHRFPIEAAFHSYGSTCLFIKKRKEPCMISMFAIFCILYEIKRINISKWYEMLQDIT